MPQTSQVAVGPVTIGEPSRLDLSFLNLSSVLAVAPSLQIPLHISLSCATWNQPPSSILNRFKSFLTLSLHRCLVPWAGLRWGSHPKRSFFGRRESSILATWPTHHSLLAATTSSSASSAPNLLLTCTLVSLCWRCWTLVMPSMHLRHLLLKDSNFRVAALLLTHVSAP